MFDRPDVRSDIEVNQGFKGELTKSGVEDDKNSHGNSNFNRCETNLISF